MPTLDEALSRIHRRLKDAGSSHRGGDEWLCPVHEVDGRPHTASLTVKRGDEPGHIVLRCARCGTHPVLDVLDLSYGDLRYDGDTNRTPIGKPILHPYPNADGEKYLRVKRQRMSVGRPKVRPQRWTGSRWATGRGDREPVLYGLPDLLKAIRKGKTIHLTEGESDADALNDWFKRHKVTAFATTHPEGAGKWRDAYVPSLAGAAQVVVWADRDAAGYACAVKRFSALRSAGLPVELRLPIPDHEKADVRDHLDAGHTPDDGKLVTLTELSLLRDSVSAEHDDEAVQRELERLRVRDRAQELHRATKADQEFRPPTSDLDLAAALARTREPLSYTIDRLHPTGANSLIAAQYKVGKTSLMANLLKSYADGDQFLGEFKVEPGRGRIALFNYELTEDMLLDEYLGPMGFENPERVVILNLRGCNFDLRSPATSAWAVEWLKARDCDALVLDPFGAAARLNNENDNSEARNWLLGVLDPLKAAAGIRDLWMPAHTGRGQAEEGEEHARGASAVDDWADVRWNYTKAHVSAENGPGWRRFISAHGRAVDVPERELGFDVADRSLYVTQYRSRSEVRAFAAIDQVVRAVESQPGINATDLKSALSIGNREKSRVIEQAVRDGLVQLKVGEPGSRRNAKHYYPAQESSDA